MTEAAVPEIVPTKKWYTSKTLWANSISVVGLVLAKFTGVELDAATAAGILAVINLVLRVITKQGLSA